MAPTDDEKRKITESTPPKKRVNKPLIEKRRRERINECLNQLQTLISQLDKDKYKVGRPAKLEKADILEMTVDFVRKTKTTVQVLPNEETDIHEQSYIAGYKKCMNEIQNFCKDNTIPIDLKASLEQQIDYKLRQMKTEDKAVDLSTKSDKKDVHFTEQMLEFANCSPPIQPKCTSQVSSSANSVQMTPQVQIIQRPTNTNNQVTVVCQKEPPTYVLVPTAAFCQPIQIPNASQGFPVIVQNGTTPSLELKSNIVEKSGHMFPPTSTLHNNQGQVIMFPNAPMSIPMINTNFSSGNIFSSSIYKQPSVSTIVPSHLPKMSPSLLPISGTTLLSSSSHVSIPGSEKREITLGNERPANESQEPSDRNDFQIDPMWRPW